MNSKKKQEREIDIILERDQIRDRENARFDGAHHDLWIDKCSPDKSKLKVFTCPS
jgi:hypothetical protein